MSILDTILEREPFKPENAQRLIALFIRASMKYPANISGQGIWLDIFFREGKEAGKLPEKLSLYGLQRVLTSEVKGDVLHTIANAAQRAHRHLPNQPSVAPDHLESIITAVLEVSRWCQFLPRAHLDALLQMLPVYMEAGKCATRNDEEDAQNPEILRRKTQITAIALEAFDGEFQRLVIESIDQVLFTRMVSHHNYVDGRFKIFLSRFWVFYLRTERLRKEQQS